MKKKYRNLTIYTCTIGLLMSVFSVASDHLPYVGEEVSFVQSIIMYLAVLINSLSFWFIYSMIVGYKFAENLKEAALFACLSVICSITFYLVIGSFYEDHAFTSSLLEKLKNFGSWYAPSIVGGIAGGTTGYLTKRNRYTLSLLGAVLLFQLLINGSTSWGNAVGLATNLTFCAVLLITTAYLVYISVPRNRFQN
ncbi:hypothetical protein H0266_08040 [Halobacillus locisalis]|uniref:Uncharacterized protein n=1 Tax=Halobacillus locisalis TaxID=220753 RepID=A0A838CS43_9BACI|nr:hypothetical protein [Halobacillus locisalis]MBA2174840.1 hypothetical protein [Halobacillus locisalis]